MPKKFFKRILPDLEWIRNHSHLKIFGTLHHNPNLWYLNKHSVAGAFAVGLFTAWVPLPFQMVIAAAAAIFLQVNLPLSVVLVWISNPITMAPMFLGAYTLGASLLGITPQDLDFELSIQWLNQKLNRVWQPLLLGCFIFAALSSATGYLTIRLLWRYHIIKRWQLKKKFQMRLKRFKKKSE